MSFTLENAQPRPFGPIDNVRARVATHGVLYQRLRRAWVRRRTHKRERPRTVRASCNCWHPTVTNESPPVPSFPLLSDIPTHMAAAPERTGAGERLRRCADRLIALVLLVLFSPLMLACAALIRKDGGPASFAHYRVGSRGRLFRCFKFRTMCIDAERVLGELLEKDPALRD